MSGEIQVKLVGDPTAEFEQTVAEFWKRDRDELKEMKAVLEWASENVECCDRISKVLKAPWTVSTWEGNDYQEPTLYQALHTAWEKRDE